MPRNIALYASFIAACLLLSSCGKYIKETGKASYYANSFNGKKTASGQVFNNNNLTAAHKTIPFGTVVTVKNVSNGKTVDVTITDRGPYAKGRVIDLTAKAASAIGMISQGVAEVQLKYRRKKN